MIADHDRSYWIGASDVEKVIGNWHTKSWMDWWMQKIGINTDHFENKFMMAGTNYEHRILESLNIPGMELDKQFRNEDLRLRVNLDGNTETVNYECKTFQQSKGFKLPKKYIHQTQVQMYGSGLRETVLVAYGLLEEEYDNYLSPIDPERIQRFPISYDPEWIEKVWLPKQMELAECLREGRLPSCLIGG